LTADLTLLLAVLAAFAVLDIVALQRMHRIEGRAEGDLPGSRDAADRLARFLLTAGAGLAIAFAAVFLVLVLT